VHSWSLLVRGRATGKHELTKFNTTQTWGKPSPPPLQYYMCLATRPTPKCHFALRLSNWNFLMQRILMFVIAFWKFGSPSKLQLTKCEVIWECVGSFPTLSLHSRKHEIWLSSFTFGSHLCKPLIWLRTQN
jgi:hypothetical protein